MYSLFYCSYTEKKHNLLPLIHSFPSFLPFVKRTIKKKHTRWLMISSTTCAKRSQSFTACYRNALFNLAQTSQPRCLLWQDVMNVDTVMPNKRNSNAAPVEWLITATESQRGDWAAHKGQICAMDRVVGAALKEQVQNGHLPEDN